MTCIAVIRHENDLWMAGDRRLSYDDGRIVKLPRPKIANRGGVLIGAAGHSYMCTGLVDLMPVPAIPEYLSEESVFEYMHNKFIPSLQQFIANSPKGWDSIKDISALVGIDTYLFNIITDEKDKEIIVEIVETPFAIGSGGSVALGALLALQKPKSNPYQILTKALTLVSKVKSCCDSNIDIISN